MVIKLINHPWYSDYIKYSPPSKRCFYKWNHGQSNANKFKIYNGKKKVFALVVTPFKMISNATEVWPVGASSLTITEIEINWVQWMCLEWL